MRMLRRTLRAGTLLWGVVLIVGLAACEGVVDPDPVGAEQFDPADYGWDWQALYEDVQDCIGVRGDYDRLTFYWVEEIKPPDADVVGFWEPPHRIYIKGSALDGVSHRLVKHEMLHDLLRPGDHDSPRFEACERGG